MTDAADSASSTSMLLGEMRGQLRELVHSVNNLSQKVDTVFDRTSRTHSTPEDLKALEVRVALLEATQHRRDGATSIGSLILRSPALGWLVGAAAAVWALLSKGNG